MDIGKSFGYVFEDDDWVTKLLAGGVLNLTVVGALATVGYQVRTLRNVARGSERPLPEWDDFGDYFVKGIMVLVAGLIYALPAILVGTVGLFISAVSGAGVEREVPLLLTLCTTSLWCLATAYGLLLGLWMPGATVKYALSGDFGAFFRVGEIWSFISNNLGGYVVALVVAWLAGIAAALAGSVLCFVGAAFTGFWAMLVYAHLFGQVAREPAVAEPTATAAP